MSRQNTPRSILKCSSPSSSAPHPHGTVRFPSSPKLSTVHLTHCPTSYDRTPIVVLPNTCALPERGCRTYSAGLPISPPPSQATFTWGNHVHPSILNRGQYGEVYDGGLVPPPLTSDDGSSEESDGIASPPPEAASNTSYRTHVPSQSHLHSEPLSHPPISQPYEATGTMYPYTSTHDGTPSEYSLSFLPHAPPACATRKREKSKSHRLAELRATSSSFCSSWGQTDESSCLGGF